jgi:ribosomal protein L22
MTRTLWNLMDHAKHKGMIPMRLFIHGCIIGKTKRYYGVRYQAKGRGYK